MTTSIRKLQSTDVEVLRGLLKVFGKAFDEEETYCNHQPESNYLQQLLSGDSFIAVAAVSDEEVIGGLVAYELKKFEQRRSEIYIYDSCELGSTAQTGLRP